MSTFEKALAIAFIVGVVLLFGGLLAQALVLAAHAEREGGEL